MLKFVHIPKTAGVSICKAIGQSYGHKPPVAIKRSSCVFTCVRNPYDRAVSLFYFLKDRSPEYKAQFMASDETVNSFWQHKAGHIRPIKFTQSQVSWIRNAERLDKIIRFENLSDDWASFAEIHKLPPLPHKNINESRPSMSWQDELTPESIAKIGELYADDFENLNYERIS